MNDPGSRLLHVLGVVVLALCVAFGAHSRIRAATSEAAFDAQQPVGNLKSDPALLYYLVERVVLAGGVPEDWRADGRIAHPDTVDVPAVYTVGQEFLIAWAYGHFGGDVPLHLFCVRLMAIVASLTVIGVYGCAYELTRTVRSALVAALLFTLLPASYRTLGFVLVREDLALPLFALHIWALARAARRRTTIAMLCAGATLAAALATWHAMAWFAALESFVLCAWLMRTGESPFASGRARVALLVLILGCLLVPALAAKTTVLSPALLLAFGLAGAGFVRGASDARRRMVALGVIGAGFAVAVTWARVTQAGDFGHVIELLRTKLVHLGQLPTDADMLSFEARMLWQGPFETLPPSRFPHELGYTLLLCLPALLVGARHWLRPERSERARQLAILAGAALLSLVVAWLVQRLVVLPGLLLPILGAVTVQQGHLYLVRRFPHARKRQVPLVVVSAVVAFVFLLQAAMFTARMRAPIFWYRQPPRPQALVQMIAAVKTHVPADQAVAADFMVSTAVLAHTRRPIVLQPKWETAASRLRVERYWDRFYHDTPQAFAELLDEWDCHYLLVDRATSWGLRATRYLARLESASEPPPGTAAAVLMTRDAGAAASVPSFELLWSGEQNADLRLYRRKP